MDAKEVSKQVPTIYYDLIGRVVPGFPFVLVGLFSLPNLRQLAVIPGVPAILLISVVIFSYLVGMLLTIAAQVFRVPSLVYRRCRIEETSKFDSMVDTVLVTKPEMGSTLLKMRAETRLFQNLLVGVLIMWGCHGLGWLRIAPQVSPWAWFALASFLALAAVTRNSLYRRRSRDIHRRVALVSHVKEPNGHTGRQLEV